MSELTIKLRHVAAAMTTTLRHGALMREAADDIDRLERDNAALREEVVILRRFGNKDCTRMADEELERVRTEAPGGGPENG